MARGSSKAKTSAKDGTQQLGSSVTPRERKILQLEDKEGIGREELVWGEKEEMHRLLQSSEKTFEFFRERERRRREKELREAELAERTRVRRQKNIFDQEQRQRLLLLETEQQEVEVMLRALEKEIRSDVYEVVAEMALRVKYFNKTMDVIVRNEQAYRRELENSERYERLVLRSRMDNTATDILLEEQLDQLRKNTEGKYVERRTQSMRRIHTQQQKHSELEAKAGQKGSQRCESQPTPREEEESQEQQKEETQEGGTAPSQEATVDEEEKKGSDTAEGEQSGEMRNDDDAEEHVSQGTSETGSPASSTSRSRQKHSGRKRLSAVTAKVQPQHSPQFYDRAITKLEDRQAEQRQQLEEDEALHFANLTDYLDYLLDQCKMDEELVEEQRERTQAHYNQRQQLGLVQDEARQRQALLRDEDGARKTLERKAFREQLDTQRREETEQYQQSVHERKIVDRRQRILVRQYRVEATQYQRAQRGGCEEEPLYPPVATAMTPIPPHVIAQQNRDLTPETGGGGFLSHEEKRFAAVLRIISGNEVSQRQLVEKEERLDRHTLLKQSQKVGASYDERETVARSRRTQLAVGQEKRTLERLQYEEERNGVARQLREARGVDRTLAELQRQEGAGRVAITAERNQLLKESAVQSQQLLRLFNAFNALVNTEQAQRTELADQEARLRESLGDVAKSHKPKAPRRPASPLPVPKPGYCYRLPKKVRQPNPRQPEYDASKYQRKQQRVVQIASIRKMLFRETTASSVSKATTEREIEEEQQQSAAPMKPLPPKGLEVSQSEKRRNAYERRLSPRRRAQHKKTIRTTSPSKGKRKGATAEKPKEEKSSAPAKEEEKELESPGSSSRQDSRRSTSPEVSSSRRSPSEEEGPRTPRREAQNTTDDERRDDDAERPQSAGAQSYDSRNLSPIVDGNAEQEQQQHEEQQQQQQEEEEHTVEDTGDAAADTTGTGSPKQEESQPTVEASHTEPQDEDSFYHSPEPSAAPEPAAAAPQEESSVYVSNSSVQYSDDFND